MEQTFIDLNKCKKYGNNKKEHYYGYVYNLCKENIFFDRKEGSQKLTEDNKVSKRFFSVVLIFLCSSL
ncbi:MAG: hypothetical protein AMS27_10335 [Bacteroides sp. SM23_62_1]|nr:MAG: hypothetical protein AMS27_10335 [Bacteroides sp. SM23_62_1]